MAVFGESISGAEEPPQPEFFVIEGGDQELQLSAEEELEQQAARAAELIDLIDQIQQALEALPREAIIHAAGTAITEHHSAIAKRGNDDPESVRLADIKDRRLGKLSPDERGRAIFDAYDNLHNQAA